MEEKLQEMIKELNNVLAEENIQLDYDEYEDYLFDNVDSDDLLEIKKYNLVTLGWEDYVNLMTS